MRQLTFLHLAVHNQLQKLLSFDGLSNLKRLLLAVLGSLTELPSFQSLGKLERVDFAYLPRLRVLPDLASATNLHTLTSVLSMQFCCNGFLGSCNLSHPFCTPAPLFGFRGAECIQNASILATAATKQTFIKNAAHLCQTTTMVSAEELTRESIDICGGQPFRQCQLSSRSTATNSSTSITGICFNTRLQVLACTSDPLKIQVRKLQIQRGIGPTCDPAVEAWLGCS